MDSIPSACFRTPFCDWLSISVPEGDAFHLREELGNLLLEAGAISDPAGFSFHATGGRVQIRGHGSVWSFSFSGAALDAIRERVGLPDLLAVLWTYPHRVTRLDVAYDTPDHGADIVPAIEAAGHTGRLRLSRKAIPASAVRWQRAIGPCERLTGTVYLGRLGKAEVVARVYDKRAQVWDKRGVDVGHGWTRYELELRVAGMGVRDAHDPAALFWHYGGEALTGEMRPPGIEAWGPNGEGYALEARPERSPFEKLQRRVNGSDELDAWLKLADQMGERGRHVLLSIVRQRLGVEYG